MEKLKVKVTSPDGLVEERIITINVMANLQVKFSYIDYNSSPRIGKMQKMKVSINNVDKVAPVEKMYLELTSEESTSNLRIDYGSVEVYQLPVGSIWSIPGLAYTVLNQQALNRGITMKLSLKHGTRVVFTQDLKLQ